MSLIHNLAIVSRDSCWSKAVSSTSSPTCIFSFITDPNMLSEVQLWKASLDDLNSQILGHTDVKLEGNETICRQYECNLGSLKIN